VHRPEQFIFASGAAGAFSYEDKWQLNPAGCDGLETRGMPHGAGGMSHGAGMRWVWKRDSLHKSLETYTAPLQLLG
jgi:hypothetical protein